MVLRELMDDVARQFIQRNRIFLKIVIHKETYAIVSVSRPYKIESSKCYKDKVICFVGSNGVLAISNDYAVLSESMPKIFLELILRSKTNWKGIVARRERRKLRKYLKELEIPKGIKEDLEKIAQGGVIC